MEKYSWIFDTHAHYDDEAFDSDRDQILSELTNYGVGAVVNVSSDFSSVSKTIDLTKKYSFIYGAVGIHPDNVKELNDDRLSQLRELAAMEKIVAFGEIGLDYYWNKQNHETQKKWFREQLKTAYELKLPVIIHSREAAMDTYNILQEEAKKGLCGVIHCYSYSSEMARDYIESGFYIGIGGVVTFKNAKKVKETVKEIPLERIVLETDCPYLAPDPHRGTRNFSGNLHLVAGEIAQIKEISIQQVIEQTTRNAKALYNLPD